MDLIIVTLLVLTSIIIICASCIVIKENHNKLIDRTVDKAIKIIRYAMDDYNAPNRVVSVATKPTPASPTPPTPPTPQSADDIIRDLGSAIDAALEEV